MPSLRSTELSEVKALVDFCSTAEYSAGPNETSHVHLIA